MRIIVGFPSLDNSPGFPQVGANRQFQYLSHGAAIFPPIIAYAATMLKNAGHEVSFLDGPVLGWDWERYLKEIELIQPDLIAWEVKTPTVKRVWPLVDQVKKLIPHCKVVLMGDHITALPHESITHCEVDFCLTGGDYDFGLIEIIKCILSSKPRENYQVFESQFIKERFIGLNYPTNRYIFEQPTDSKLDTLPIIDRELCDWRLYGYENGSGNYKYLPGTHTMFGRDCWWRHEGGCTFCSWTNTFKNWRVCSVDQAMAEIENCASLGIREVFDDTGTFPIGKWLHEFCDKLRKFNGGKKHGKCRITMGCNMRPGALKKEDWKAMASAGFRFILFGLESANQSTLERINKGQAPGDIERSCKDASEEGLDPHATCMVGYPWESRSNAERTIALTRNLFRKGWIKTLQATIVIPYPGTQLFNDCKKEGLLKTEEWNEYDMSKPVMKCPMSDEEVLAMTRGIYKSCITPSFIFKKLVSIRNLDDLRFIAKGAKYMLGHLKDFSRVQVH